MAALVLGSCGDDDPNRGGGGSAGTGLNGTGNAEPVPLDPTDYTYRLEESTAEVVLWTTPATHKVRTNERPPDALRSGLRLSAARNEFEPVQLLIGPASGTVNVSIDPFPNLGGGQRVELAVAGYESGWAEHLSPIGSGGSMTLSADQPAPLWITVYVPTDAPV